MNSKGKRNTGKDKGDRRGGPRDLFNLSSPNSYNSPIFTPHIGYGGSSKGRFFNLSENESPTKKNSSNSSSGLANEPFASEGPSDDNAEGAPDTPKAKKEQTVFDSIPTSSFEEVAFAAENGLGPLVPSAASPTLPQGGSDADGNRAYSLDSDYFGGFSTLSLGTRQRREGQNEYVFEFFGMDAEKLEEYAMSKEIKPLRVRPGSTGNMIVCTYVFGDEEAGEKVRAVLDYRKIESGNIIGVHQVQSQNEKAKTSIIVDNNRFDDDMEMVQDREFTWKGLGLLSFIFAWLWDLIESFFGW